MTDWRPLKEALDRHSDRGMAPAFWLRDDDAVAVTAPLVRLGELTREAGVPAVLAVIPARADTALAEWTKGQPHLSAAVHGFAHTNHAPQGERPQEFGPHRALAVMSAELREAQERVKSLFATSVRPMFVPPWNRMTPALAPLLPSLGFEMLSKFGPSDANSPGLTVLNCAIDIIDWRGGRVCRAPDKMIADLAELLSAPSAAKPIGILTHHLVHDEAAWTFLAHLFEATAGRARWVAPR